MKTILLFLLLSTTLHAQRFVQTFVSRPQFRTAWVGLHIVELESGKEVASHQPQRSFAPASTLKLFSTAAALEEKGAEFRYTTTFGYRGTIDKDGLLVGDLIVRGGGDPALGSEYVGNEPRRFLAEWFSAAKNNGIKRVKGRILVDDSHYNYEPMPVRWTRQDAGNYYAAGVYGVNIFDNLYRISFQSAGVGSSPSIVSIIPRSAESLLNFNNNLRAASNKMDSAYIYGEPYRWQRSLFGTIPAGETNFTVRGDLPDPAFLLAKELFEELKKGGITVEQGFTTQRLLSATDSKDSAPEIQPLVVHRSPTLAELVKVTNFRSFNLFAESMVRLMASTSPGAPFPVGVRRIADHWRRRGVDMQGVVLHDGSGLSPFNRVTPKAVTTLLLKMHGSNEREAFFASLPTVGREGSVRSFLKGTPMEEKAQLKSGFYEGVLAYAGIVEKGGRRYALSVMVNGFTGSVGETRKAIETMINSPW